ncbi:MAG: aminotransferase class I/II-fold pyridoxal phosphate-dependent enzyme, partial [Candidatus Riflebacteria bacterium]|nr:aminotransferase class I/II-fold pyridoxal phosphate-dependent enzyme [Candidatus Riflebacteria bacterium]
ERLARICVEHDIYLISDEVYREMILGDEEAVSVLQIDLHDDELNEMLINRMIVVDSASKTFSLCGSRIGFVVSLQPIVNTIALVNAHTVACISDMMQYGVANCYDAVMWRPEYLVDFRNIYKERLDATMDAIHKYLPHCIVSRPKGAFYVMIKFPELDDVNEFCHYTLEHFNMGGETVALTPAKNFYLAPNLGKNEVRIALVVSPEKMRRSIQIVSQSLKSYKRYKSNMASHMRQLL